MKIFAVINQKGGVGKTTTAAALGAGLALRGYKTLIVDLDAQGNLSYSMNSNTPKLTALQALQRAELSAAAIQHTEQGDIIASSPALAGADTLITQTGKEYRLKEALQTIAAEYDYCVIDSPPALGILTVNALTACTMAIIPAQADIYSLQGITQLTGTIDAIRRYCNPALTYENVGILLTRFNRRSIIRRDVADLLERTAAELGATLYNTRIRECTALVEAQTVRRSIFDYAPRSNAAADYNAFIGEVLREEQL